jgi:hypothetical protein
MAGTVLRAQQRRNWKHWSLVAAMYMTMAGISDTTLGVWLGLLMMTRRSHPGARRVGVLDLLFILLNLLSQRQRFWTF